MVNHHIFNIQHLNQDLPGRIEAIGGGTGLSYNHPGNPTLNQGVSNGGGRSFPAPASANFWTPQAPTPSVTVPLGGTLYAYNQGKYCGGYSGELHHPLVVHVEVAVVVVLIVDILVVVHIAVLVAMWCPGRLNLILMEIIISGQLGVVLIHLATPLYTT